MAPRKSRDDEESVNPFADPDSEVFTSLGNEAAPEPEPVESGEITHEVSDHKHRFQLFRESGTRKSVERCVTCTKVKGARA